MFAVIIILVVLGLLATSPPRPALPAEPEPRPERVGQHARAVRHPDKPQALTATHRGRNLPPIGEVSASRIAQPGAQSETSARAPGERWGS